MTADRHDAAFLTSKVTAHQCQVCNGLDVFDAKLVLGQSHRIANDCRLSCTVQLGKALDLGTCNAGFLLNLGPIQSADEGLYFLNSRRPLRKVFPIF